MFLGSWSLNRIHLVLIEIFEKHFVTIYLNRVLKHTVPPHVFTQVANQNALRGPTPILELWFLREN